MLPWKMNFNLVEEKKKKKKNLAKVAPRRFKE